ncbi:MAG TPA: YgiT-type zinc finger protein [Thermodesulfovibrionales bacterium]|nr:YgiT-type zinc finger protein [Thermodesulfovibrionales bacterium]
MKTCYFCKGDVEIRKISHVHNWGHDYYLFENVQAEVCRQCGEVFFLPETLKLMDEYVREKRRSEKTISIPVIKMPDMAVA